MIIDAHAHLGVDRVFDEVRTEEEILQTMDQNGVDVTLVQPMFGTVDLNGICESHNRIYRFSQANPRRIFGMISMTPLIHEADYYNEAKRCIKELGFVGLKIHPSVHAVSPTSKVAHWGWCAIRAAGHGHQSLQAIPECQLHPCSFGDDLFRR
jgi:predicted TIM-barrel fold metal-dependent hydrolase